MIIYRILNKINNKSYIGQSVLTFNKRYRGGEWWNMIKLHFIYLVNFVI